MTNYLLTLLSVLCLHTGTVHTLSLPAGRAPAPRVRAGPPVMQFSVDGLFGKKKEQTKQVGGDPTLRDQATWTAEDRKRVTDMASNWAGERKPNQEGYTFFQSPSPVTGEQQDMPDFFSKETLAGQDVPGIAVVLGAIAVIGTVTLLVGVVSA